MLLLYNEPTIHGRLFLYKLNYWKDKNKKCGLIKYSVYAPVTLPWIGVFPK
jgi:hypothetical protein